MKKILFPILLMGALAVHAQDTYINERVANNSSDVIGSARFVGMGGAMGALGADISTMSWNPAGIGLMRKSDVSLSFGRLWGKSSIKEEDNATAVFDQAGIVLAVNCNNENLKYLNFGINYQKKADYNYNYYADNHNLRGLSQMDQLAEMANNLSTSKDIYSHYDLAYYDEYLSEGQDKIIRNLYDGEEGFYTHHSQGSLQGFDFNVSTNLNNRFYLGLTFGLDNLSYKGWNEYLETSSRMNGDVKLFGDYGLYNDTHISGVGFNVKLGTIIRPVESSSFRLAFAVETPTWYKLKNTTEFGMAPIENNHISYNDYFENYLQNTLTSPWKVRLGMGSTSGQSFAWDIDYEYAGYGGMKSGYWEEYPNYDYSVSVDREPDYVMNEHTRSTLKGTHTLRAGMEYRPVSSFALRLGYNYTSSPYKDNVSFDQYTLADSPAMGYASSTSYMRTGDTNILTLGMGYRYKSFYVDLAYKIRNQSADFYAFDTSFTSPGLDFALDNPNMQGMTLDPVNVNLTRQTVTCTLGFKF